MPDRFDRAWELADERNFPAALEAAQQACAMKPDDADDWWLLSGFHELVGQHAESLAALLRADRLRPGEPRVLLDIAEARLRLGDPAGALADIRRALAVEPDLVVAHFTLGTTQRLLGQNAAAVESFDAAARALVNRWARDLPGEGEGPRRPYRRPSDGRWMEYAAVAARAVTERSVIGRFTLPSADTADEGAGPFRVRYWRDVSSADGRKIRRFLPGFLDALVAFLRADGLYARVMEEWSGALVTSGEAEEARKFREEARHFQRWAGLEPTPAPSGATT